MSVGAARQFENKARLEHFRSVRARLDPSGDPAEAMAKAYVQLPRSVSSLLAAELMLSPASSHLLIGGVGSGKTTELLATQREITAIDDVRTLYVDVSKRHDIGKMIPGAVAIQVGLALAEVLETEVAKKIAQRVDAIANGYWDEWDYPDHDGDAHYVPGILISPERVEEKVQEALRPLLELLPELAASGAKHLVALLDGLDRIPDVKAFEEVVRHDIKALTRAGIGVVLVGPLRALYGLDRTITERFDSFHYQAWIDITQNSAGFNFLADVLSKRVPPGEITPDALHLLVQYSGGVLRDLLALAQAACVEAYMSGADEIGDRAVYSAIDAFGRKHMQGLRPAELDVLQRVRTKGTFVHTSEDDLALLMTRRVLEYRSHGQPRYAVHPTIVQILEELGK